MKRLAILLGLLAVPFIARAQQSAWGTQLIGQPNSQAGRAYIGVSNVWDSLLAGPNITFTTVGRKLQISSTGGGGTNGGNGTVTNFHAGNLSPLFTTSVTSPTNNPTLSFAQVNQSANLVLVGPISGGAAAPTFRALVPADEGAFTNHSDVLPTSLTPGQVLVWSGTAWTNGVLAAIAAVTVTNAGNPNFSLINSSNSPTFKFKSLSAGANVTLTDQGTNIDISATSSSGDGSTTNFDQNFFDDNVYVADEEFDQWRGTGSGQFTRGSGWAVTTVGGGGGVATVNSNVPPYYGLIEITGSTTPTNGVFVSQSSASGISIYQNLSAASNWLFHGVFFLHVTNTGSIYRFGLADGINSAVAPALFPSNSIGVRWYKNLNDANTFVFDARSNAISKSVASSVVVALDTAYKFSMWSTNAGVVWFSINGETPVSLTNTPNQSLSMLAYVSTTNATAGRMWIDRMAFRATGLGR